MSRINHIGITRLFSTGRFEHLKLSVGIDPGSSPAGAMLEEIEQLLADLNPSCPVDDYAHERALRIVANPPAEEEDPDPFSDSLEDAIAVIAKVEEWQAKRKAAFRRLDEIGASVELEEKDSTPIY